MAVSRHRDRVRPPEHQRPVVGVVGGDATCVRALVQRWTGRVASPAIVRSTVHVPDEAGRQDLVVLSGPSPLTPWPGGPLIWLFPERGPSEPELAALRQVLQANSAARPSLRVLVCVPHDVSVDAASADLDTISETLHWGLDADVEMELEAVWLGGNEAAGLDRWLSGLARETRR